jgi:hypothetical protein
MGKECALSLDKPVPSSPGPILSATFHDSHKFMYLNDVARIWKCSMKNLCKGRVARGDAGGKRSSGHESARIPEIHTQTTMDGAGPRSGVSAKNLLAMRT